jgi:hypothetical protein
VPSSLRASTTPQHVERRDRRTARKLCLTQHGWCSSTKPARLPAWRVCAGAVRAIAADRLRAAWICPAVADFQRAHGCTDFPTWLSTHHAPFNRPNCKARLSISAMRRQLYLPTLTAAASIQAPRFFAPAPPMKSYSRVTHESGMTCCTPTSAM